MTDDLTGLPGRVQAELTRLRAERQVFAAEQDRLKARLVSTEQELQSLVSGARELAERELQVTELSARVRVLERENGAQTTRIAALSRDRDSLTTELASCRQVSARVHALESDVGVARRERDLMRAELTTSREDRDRLRLRLLDAELVLASGSPVAASVEAAAPSTDLRRALLAEQQVEELTRELTATRLTLSWRVTAPLRALRRGTRRRGHPGCACCRPAAHCPAWPRSWPTPFARSAVRRPSSWARFLSLSPTRCTC